MPSGGFGGGEKVCDGVLLGEGGRAGDGTTGRARGGAVMVAGRAELVHTAYLQGAA